MQTIPIRNRSEYDVVVSGERPDIAERVLVASTAGIFRAPDESLPANATVGPDDCLAVVEAREGDVEVRPSDRCRFMAFLAMSGERVQPGQALVWLQPLAARGDG